MGGGLDFIVVAVSEVIVGSLDQLIAPPRPSTGAQVGGVRADPGVRATAEAEFEAGFLREAAGGGADGGPGEVGVGGVG